MGSFDRGFENALELRAGEVIRWSSPAMRRVRRIWVGGRIYVSDERFFFCPGVLVRRRYGVLRIPLAVITSFDVFDRELSLQSVATGGLKPRVQLATTAGDQHAFTMQAFERRVGELQPLLPS